MTDILFDGVMKAFTGRGHSAEGGDTFAALGGVDLRIRSGELTVIVGPSGCGKSTLLDLLAGLTVPTSGEIRIDGRVVDGPGLDRGVVFQQYALLPWRTAQGNVELGLEAKKLPKKERQDRAREYLDLVGLSGFDNHYPGELSGGMKQRVALARSLAFDPEVLLMDEPFAALDAQTRDRLQEELLRIWERTGKTIVFITHGIDEAIYLGERVAVLTARPGTVKDVVEVDIGHRSERADLRSDADFAHYRHQVWTLLQSEVEHMEADERVGARVTRDKAVAVPDLGSKGSLSETDSEVARVG